MRNLEKEAGTMIARKVAALVGTAMVAVLCGVARADLLDEVRAVDYVQTRPEIDGTRLGVAGTSGGGTMSAYLQAVDAQNGRPVTLRAKGWDCIAAAHAFAAEPQLFDGVRLEEPPPSWTEMVTSPDPKDDSFAVGVWGALEEYDWTDLVPELEPKGEKAR